MRSARLLAASATRRLRRTTDEPEARGRFIERAAEFTPYVGVESAGLTFLAATRDRKMAKFFTKQTRPELRVLQAALALLESNGAGRRDGMFVDVGANIGTTTLFALREGFTSVLACEPEPESVRLLRASAILNGAESAVRVIEVALSDRAGTASLDQGRGTLSKARLLAGPEDRARGTTIDVRLVPLDDLAAEGVLDPADVAMLWLDVEGHEYNVLAGAARVLEHSPPLVMELSPKLLRTAGGLDRLPELLTRHYTHVADLRHGDSELMPVEALASVIEQYEESHTDLLLCRIS